MPRRASLLALALALHACNSDDTEQWPPETTSTGGTTTTTTGPPTTGELTTTTTTTSTTGAPTTGEPPAPPPTCKDVLDCVLPCLLGGLDFECAAACADGLPPGEAAEILQLGLCVGTACFESGACSTEDLMSPVCLACIGFLLMDSSPEGCEAEAEACAT